MQNLLSLLLACLTLAGCTGQGAIFQPAPFIPPPAEVASPGGSLDTAAAEEHVRKAAETLEGLGIDGATETGERLLADMAVDGSYALFLTSPADAAIWLLSDIGCGQWAEDTWEWSPTSSQVYWMDFEWGNMDRMYTEALAGIAAITEGDAVFADVAEDTSGVDYEQDSGTQVITFTCNGETCRYEARFMGDWLDEGFLGYMGRLLSRHNTAKQLYFCYDNGQGCILLWQTAAWAERLQQQLDLRLEPAGNYF